MTAAQRSVVLSAVVVSALLLSGIATGMLSMVHSDRGATPPGSLNVTSDLPEAGGYIAPDGSIGASPLAAPKPLIEKMPGRDILPASEKEAILNSFHRNGDMLAPGGGIDPKDSDAAGVIGAPAAWSVTMGRGANIALIDSGVDFGHDDLVGSWVTVTDPSSPYYGWPIAFDANAQGLYLKYGLPLALESSDWMSSYANMKYRQVVSADTNGTPARDYWGNPVASLSDITFYLPPGGDVIPPGASWIYPADGSANVPPMTEVVFKFSEPMDNASVEGAVSVQPSGNITLRWSADRTTLYVRNETNGMWQAGFVNISIANAAAMDTAGNPLGGGIGWTYTNFTVVSPDVTAPTVLWVSPAAGAVNLVNTTSFTVMFSEQMNRSATESGITIPGGPSLVFEWGESGRMVTAVPVPILNSSTAYTLQIDNTKVKDLAGNFLPAPSSVAISTEASDTTPPTIVSTTPAAGALDYPYALVIEFSERMDPATMNLTKLARGIHLFPNAHADLSKDWSASWNLNATRLTLVPTSPYRSSTQYRSDFTIRIDDGSGKYLEYTDGNSLDGYQTLARDPPFSQAKLARIYAIDGMLSGGSYTNQSAAYRLGVHKDQNIQALYGERIGMLATANATGVYDRVYVDLNDNQMFTDDAPGRKSAPIKGEDIDGDGYIDLDTGLLYWISDGTNLPPYADVMAKHHNYSLPSPPEAGEIVLMSGEFASPTFDTDFGHGTEVAAAAAGTGSGMRIMPGSLTGVAPEAGLIPTGSFQFTQAVDAANKLNHTLSMFYFAVEGYDGIPGTGDEANVAVMTPTPPTGELSGLSFYDRFVDYVTTDVGMGKTLFVQAAGDDGPGYGTIPAFGGASTALTVGDAFHMYYRPLLGSDGGPVLQSGYVNTYIASRGPTASGQPKPDVLGPGTFSWVARPLSEGYAMGWWLPGMDLTAGSGLAAGVAAGEAALVYAAWNYSAMGGPPTAAHVKSIIMGGAKDLHTDPLTQGAGLLDAYTAVVMANYSSGTGVHHILPDGSSSWVPGEFRGNASNSFMKFVEPGKSYTQEIDIHNHGTSTALVNLSEGIYQKSGEWKYTYRSTGMEYFIVNASGIFNDTGVLLASVDGSLWNSENAIISVYSPEAPGAVFQAYYWTDLDSNGSYDGFSERNRFAVTITEMGQAYVPTPSTTIGDGIVLLWMGGSDVKTTLKVEFFDKAPGYITLDKTNLTLAAGQSGSFNATLSIPSDAGIGSYEFMVVYEMGGREHVIPVLASVMSHGTSGAFSGGPPGYTNSAMYGATVVAQGSRYYYYIETPSDVLQRPATKGIIDVDTLFAGTGGDMRHYVEGAPDEVSSRDPARFGPFTMVETDTGAPGSFSKDGGGVAKAFTITPGINLLEVDYTSFARQDTVESAEGEIGIFEFGPVTQDVTNWEVSVTTQQSTGYTPVYVRSTVTWNGAAGTATTTIANTSSNNVILSHPYGGEPFVEYLSKAPTRVYDNITSDVVIVSWHMIGTGDNKDSDLGVFYDSNGDLIPQVSEFVKYDADADADEQVTLILPTPGTYIMTLAGYDLNGKSSATYDWENPKTVISSSAKILPTGMPTGTINKNEKGNFLIAWKGLPEGSATGAFFLAPGDAALSFMMLVPISVNVDRTPLTIKDPIPGDGAIVNTNQPAFAVQIADPKKKANIDDTRTRLFVDGIDVTGDGRVNRDSESGGTYTAGGLVVQLKSITLTDGQHMARVVAVDFAGNVATFTWRFTVDSTAPGLMIRSPAQDREIVKDTLYNVSGVAPGATRVTISAGASIVDAVLYPNGDFYREVNLIANSVNLVTVSAEDAAGNTMTASRTIITDTLAPDIVSLMAAKSLTAEDTVQVSFSLDVSKEPGSVSASMNGAEVKVFGDGSGLASVSLAEGENNITLTVSDSVGNTASRSIRVMKDSTAPALTLSADPPAVTDQSTVKISGSATDALSNFTITVNGMLPSTGARGSAGSSTQFEAEVTLSSWSNTIVITATDEAGNSVQIVRSVGYVIKGTNYGMILGALAVVLAVLGAVIGFLLGRGMPPAPPEEEEEKEEEEKEEEEKEEEEKKEEEEVPPPSQEESVETTPMAPPEKKVETGDVLKPE